MNAFAPLPFSASPTEHGGVSSMPHNLEAEQALGSGAPFVARLDRTTRAKEREQLELAVDVERLHYFDAETGLAVRAA